MQGRAGSSGHVCILGATAQGLRRWLRPVSREVEVGRNGSLVRPRTECPWPDTRGPRGTWQQRGRLKAGPSKEGHGHALSTNLNLGEDPEVRPLPACQQILQAMTALGTT